MRIKYPVSQWQFLGYDDNRIALNCIKEWLIHEIVSIGHDIENEVKFARVQKIEPYLIQIFKSKLEERKDFLNHLLKGVLFELKNHETNSPKKGAKAP